MIDGNSRPAVGGRDPREPRSPPPRAPGHPPSVRTRRAAVATGSASDSQHVPHNGTLRGTRKSNAVPVEEDKGADPTLGRRRTGPGGSAGLMARRGVLWSPLPSAMPRPLALGLVQHFCCGDREIWDHPRKGARGGLGAAVEGPSWGGVDQRRCRGEASPVRHSGQDACAAMPVEDGGIPALWRCHGLRPGSLPAPPSGDASGEEEQHRGDRRTRTRPVGAAACHIPAHASGKPSASGRHRRGRPSRATCFFASQLWYMLNIKFGAGGG